MTDNEAINYLYVLYRAFEQLYYNGECVPQNGEGTFIIKLLEENEAEGAEGKTDFHISVENNSMAIVLKIKRELVKSENKLALCAVLLHEMVHAYCFSHGIFEMDDAKKTALHGTQFEKIAKEHGLQDGFIEPSDEIIYILEGGNDEETSDQTDQQRIIRQLRRNTNRRRTEGTARRNC